MPHPRSRRTRRLAIPALGLAVFLAGSLAGCGQEGSSSTSGTQPSGSQAAASADSVAGQLVLGGPPECPERPYCLAGLRSTYGLAFRDFRPLDAAGPNTVAALQRGEIQVAMLFTTNGQISANGWVLLEDDKQLQPSDNVTPVVADAVAAAYGQDLKTLVDGVSAKITTEDLTRLNQAVEVDKQDAEAAARRFVQDKGLAPPAGRPARSGPPVVVGSANFAESETLAQIYALVLEADGYPVQRKLRVGSREISFPALQRGEVGFMPEYAGSLLAFLDPNRAPSTDPGQTAQSLGAALAGKGVQALAAAPAQDRNGFVVTRETADRYGLAKISDLAKPAR